MKINLIFDLKGDTVLKIDNEIIKKNFFNDTDLLKKFPLNTFWRKMGIFDNC